jgi:tetratricopeptide (TPR) repeat protein
MRDAEQIFEEYQDIEPNDYLEKIRFYEQRSEQIFSLDEEQQYFLKYEFVNALFDIGRYEKVLVEVDDLIEYVFLNNISYSQEDNFAELVFLKAASTYHMGDYDNAAHLSRQLIGLNPKDQVYGELHKNAIRQKLKQKYTDLRLVAIVLILSCAIFGGVYYFKYGITENELNWSLILVNSIAILSLAITATTFDLVARYKLGVIKKEISAKKKTVK